MLRRGRTRDVLKKSTGAGARNWQMREASRRSPRRNAGIDPAALAWANDGYEWRAPVRLVDRRHIRSAAENCEARHLKAVSRAEFRPPTTALGPRE